MPIDTTQTTPEQHDRAVWSTASANDLPDSAFAYIEDGGEKDEEGKTKPRTLRHLPYKNADGKVDPAHVRNALARLSQTKIPEAAKAAAKRKLVAAAKSVGIEVSDDDDTKDRSMQSPTLIIRADGSHDPFTGTHSHHHKAFGSQGDDDGHDHEHTHDGDSDHDHDHSKKRTVDAQLTPEMLNMYAPINRIDKDNWIVEGQATSEALDSYGTIFEYESSKKAFQRWMQRGNIREQHDPRKAVGKALAVEFDDANKAIYVRARISKGARDTWEKIMDGTLSGFSIGVPAASAKRRTIERAGKQVPMYYDHELNELSVVDAPGSPGCNIAIARADGIITDVIDDVVEEPAQITEKPQESRAGARMSADTMGKMHDSIAHTLRAAMAQMQNCGCDACMAAAKMIDPDMDGDIDMGGYDDPDNDWQQLYGASDGGTDRAIAATVERILQEKLTPVYARLQGIAGTLARSNVTPELNIEASLTRALSSALDARLADLPTRSSLDEVRSELSEVKGQVVRIAETPVPGAPVQYASATQRPQAVDKRLSTDPYQAPRSSGSSVYDALRQMSAQGMLDTPEQQTDALAAALMAQRQGR